MFLNQLTDEEKNAFISLSVHTANANGIFAEDEKVMLLEYCKEMEIEYSGDSDIMTIDQVVTVFSKSTAHNKKITLFETLGLVYSDGDYDSDEKKFISNYAKKIGLTDNDVHEQVELVVKYLELLKEIVKVVS